MGAALRNGYGLSDEATAFFDLLSGPATVGFEEGVQRVIGDGLRPDVTEAEVLRAARLLRS